MRTTAFATALLNHIFTNADIAGIGDASGLQNSASAGSLYISLHTADPGEGGSQTTSEATYSGYANRQAVARSGAGWTVSGETAVNAAAITFDACNGGTSNTITYAGIGTDASGAGTLLYRCALSSPRSISNGITPKIDAGQLTVYEYDTLPA